jgi:hypothetical protein
LEEPMRAAMVAIAFLAMGCLQAREAEAQDHHPCEFQVTLPAGVDPQVRDFENDEKMRGQSVLQNFRTHFFRINCVYWNQCKFDQVSRQEKLDLIKQVASEIPGIFSPVYVIENDHRGETGKLEALIRFSDIDGMIRARVFWVRCSRLAMTFWCQLPACTGIREWVALQDAVRARPGQ